MNGKIVVLFASGALLAASSTASAQRWGNGPLPRDGACFYKDVDYQGQYFCVGAGENVDSMPAGMNDAISSIRVFGRSEVALFTNFRFNGTSTRFDYDVRDLFNEGWNDRVSSLRVLNMGFGGSRRDGGFRNDGDSRRDDDVRRDGDPRRDGDLRRDGDSRRDGDNRAGNGRGSRQQEDPDLIVRRAYQDVLGRDPDAAGMRLYRSRIIEEGWNEARIRDALRNSPEYREKSAMTMVKAQDIVRRAYLSVLKREPDAGSRGYVNDVFRNKWSQEDVERELRNSAEYRNRGR